MAIYRTKVVNPFPTIGSTGEVYAGGIPALHHLVYDSANAFQKALGHFKPDKFELNLKLYPKWLDWIAALNGGYDSIPFRYLCNNTSGVFQQGYPVLQVCSFCDIPGEPNVIMIDDTDIKTAAGVHYGHVISVRNVKGLVPASTRAEDFIPTGIVQWYTWENSKFQLFKAPKGNGRVFNVLLTDGTRLYIDMSLVEPVLPTPPGVSVATGSLPPSLGFDPIDPPEAPGGSVMHSQ